MTVSTLQFEPSYIFSEIDLLDLLLSHKKFLSSLNSFLTIGNEVLLMLIFSMYAICLLCSSVTVTQSGVVKFQQQEKQTVSTLSGAFFSYEG